MRFLKLAFFAASYEWLSFDSFLPSEWEKRHAIRFSTCLLMCMPKSCRYEESHLFPATAALQSKPSVFLVF